MGHRGPAFRKYLDGMVADVAPETSLTVEDTFVNLVDAVGHGRAVLVVVLELLVFVVGTRAAVVRLNAAALVSRELMFLEITTRRECRAWAKLTFVRSVRCISVKEEKITFQEREENIL